MDNSTTEQNDAVEHSNAPARNLLIGISLVVLAMMIVPIGDSLAKLMANYGYPPLQTTWLRYATHFTIALMLVLRFVGRSGLIPKKSRAIPLLLRGVVMTGATVCFFTSVKYLPLADAIAIVFVTPLVMTALSMPLLGERVGVWRWSSVVVGFIGALIIIRPGGDSFQWESLWALGASIGFGFYLVLTKRASGKNPPLVSLLYMGFVGTVVLGMTMPFHWVQPAGDHWFMFFAVGVSAMISHGLLIYATEYIEASVMAPLHYIEIIGATLLGFLMFDDLPDENTILGCAVVIAAGLVIIFREQRAYRKKKTT